MKMQLSKKLLLSIMAIVLVIGILVTTNVYAEDKYTIKIKKTDDGVEHTYEAYQIFSGDLYVDPSKSEEAKKTEDRNKTLSNIEWGSGIKTEAVGESEGTSKLVEELKKVKDFEKCDTPRQIAVVLESFDEDDDRLKAFAEVVSNYLQEPKTSKLSDDGENYEISVDEPGYYLIKDKDKSLDESQYAAYTRYMLKVVSSIETTPKAEKPTVTKSLSQEKTNMKVSDYAINEKFNYYLTANLPENEEFREYEKYKLVFEDTMSEGITYDGIESVKVVAKKNETEESITIELEEDKAKDTETGYKVSKSSTEKKETVVTITINDLAKILKDNKADITKGVKVIVTYKAHLNEKAEISKFEGENKPNINTAKLKYSNDPNKAGEDSMGTTLEDKNYVYTYEVENTKYGKHATQSDKDAKPLEGAGFKLYKGEDTKNEVKLKWDEKLDAYRPVKEKEDAEVIRSRKDGKFNIVGLDAGTYTLVEVETPKGYNTCENFQIKIATTLTEEKATFSKDSNMVNKIINVQGSKLPKTGSMTLIAMCGVATILGVSGLIMSKNKKEE